MKDGSFSEGFLHHNYLFIITRAIAVKPRARVNGMSDSSRQLTLFDCASLKSAAKRAKVTPEELSPETSSSDKVCDREDYSGDEEGAQMPSTPSPCCTPVAIYSSSDNESVQAGFFADDDDSHRLVHAVTPIQPGSLIDSLSSVAASSITSSTNLVRTDSSNTTTVPKPVSYRENSSSGSGHQWLAKRHSPIAMLSSSSAH